MKNFTLAVALLAVSLLAIAACGGGGDSAQVADTTTLPSTTLPSAELPSTTLPPATVSPTMVDDLLELDSGVDATEATSELAGPGLEDADGLPAQSVLDPNLGEGLAQLPALDLELLTPPEREQADIEVIYVDGELQQGERRYEVGLDERLIIEVTTNEFNQEIHIHGYDLIELAGPLAPARFDFVADLAGVWEVELEGKGELLFELAVS